MNTPAERAVDSYRPRAAWARTESRPTTPRLLSPALDGAAHVAEFPCGPGHFLSTYAKAEVRVRLIDASWPMLTAAARHARDSGVAELAVECDFLHQLPALDDDLVVVPNAALNQLAAQDPLPPVLTHLRRAVNPGTRLLLQYLAGEASGAGCGFYTPALADSHTVVDHHIHTPDGTEVIRHRRQHHTPERDQVNIEFTYTVNNRPVRTTRVHLALPTAAQVQAALTATGWATTHAHTRAGFREVLATAGNSR
ncbi:class I SAM-dependent methyltransferase [Halostreptopolyspora alba]|uniref:Class I SAM-dependent methyltransferase n=1 Tax=Halostreptopolyspora alba TaxID=2487137 RepID=A0A3N0EG56_9ACTN|nr:class I SAM-dependent methyltransferase [Nocardiopsaceae bacterium YIM 96095]